MRIYEIDPYFYEHYRELIKNEKIGRDYILFRTDIYFSEEKLAAEIDEYICNI